MIRPGALGDTLMVLPALAALKGRAKPLFCGKRTGAWAISERPSPEPWTWKRAGWHRLFSDQPLGSSPLPVSRRRTWLWHFLKTLKANHQAEPEAVFSPMPGILDFSGISAQDKRNSCGAAIWPNAWNPRGFPVNSGAVMDKARQRPPYFGPWASEKPQPESSFIPDREIQKKITPPNSGFIFSGQLHGNERLAHLKPTLLLGPAETDRLKTFFERMRICSRTYGNLFLSPNGKRY